MGGSRWTGCLITRFRSVVLINERIASGTRSSVHVKPVNYRCRFYSCRRGTFNSLFLVPPTRNVISGALHLLINFGHTTGLDETRLYAFFFGTVDAFSKVKAPIIFISLFVKVNRKSEIYVCKQEISWYFRSSESTISLLTVFVRGSKNQIWKVDSGLSASQSNARYK